MEIMIYIILGLIAIEVIMSDNKKDDIFIHDGFCPFCYSYRRDCVNNSDSFFRKEYICKRCNTRINIILSICLIFIITLIYLFLFY